MDNRIITPERYARLVKDTRTLKDVHKISNLFGEYAFLHTGAKYEECLNLFALELDDVSCEIADLGKQVGADNIRKLLVGYQFYMRGDGKGFHSEHNICTPVIEVSGDGKTAKGLWQSPGHVTYVDAQGIRPMWSWFKYGVDFIKLDNVWKIWHLHAYELFTCDYKQGWSSGMPEWYREKKANAIIASGLDCGHVTHHNPLSASYVAEPYPAVPTPYDTLEHASDLI